MLQRRRNLFVYSNESVSQFRIKKKKKLYGKIPSPCKPKSMNLLFSSLMRKKEKRFQKNKNKNIRSTMRRCQPPNYAKKIPKREI